MSRWLMWPFSKQLKAFTFVFIYFLLVLSCSFLVNLFSSYGFFSDRIPKPDGRLRTLKEGESATNKVNNCPQALDILPDFIECKRGTLLYSAWFDDRYAENYIQVLLMTSRRKQPPPLSCRFQNGSTSSISVGAVTPYYEINKRYSNKRYGLFVASCILPKDLVSLPKIVNISIANECTVVLPVGNTRKETSCKRDYGICIPPIFGNIRVADVVEFLEMSQLLGASYFTFYDNNISQSVRKVLTYYERKGLAQVLPWSLPAYITDQDVHYHGQIFSIQDCLFRSINRLNFVAFNDLDEFISPLQNKSMPSLLYSIHDSNYCGHCFSSARFPTVDSLTQNYSLFTQNVLRRSPKADSSHTKCVDDPQRVFEHGVHLIMQPFEGYKTNHVNWNKARVFHYRKCQPPCNSAADMKDTTMQKYSEQLKKNVITSFVESKVFNSSH